MTPGKRARGRVYQRQADTAAICDAYRSGLPVPLIADEFGVREGYVRRCACEAGVRRGRWRARRLDHDAIAGDYIRGRLRLQDIADLHGCHVATVSKIAKARGLLRNGGRS